MEAGPFMKSAEAASAGATTSIEKALEVCEALAWRHAGWRCPTCRARSSLPRPTVHRLLAVLKRRGYVRQDEETRATA